MQGIRLKKVAAELNVGISILVEFLAKKGHHVEMNPNTRLSTEQYDLVASAFQGVRAVKEQADKIEITPSGSNVVIESNADEKKDETDEVIIKTTQVGDLRIISKIDLDDINSKMRPDKKKKTKAEKMANTKGSKKTAETAAEPKSKPATKPVEEIKPAIPEPQAEPQSNSTPAPDKPEPVFIETQYTKLEGPKLVGMVDLSQFDKPKPSSAEKKMRKRIKNKGVVVSDTNGEPVRSATPALATPEPVFIETQYTKLESPKLVGMVDLSQFDKPKPSSTEKKMRKRIKNKGVMVSDTNGEPVRSSTPAPSKNTAKERKADIDAKSEKGEYINEGKHQSLDEMEYINSQNPIQKQPTKGTQVIKQDPILQNKKGRDIFISYSRDDKAIVFPLVKQIEQNLGVQCWIDLTGIKSGEEFEEVIINAIDECKIVLFMLSDNSLKSKWTKREVYYAEDEGKRIVPLLVDGEKLRGWFKFHFGNVDYINIQSDEQKDKLIGNLKTWLETAESEL